MLRVQAIERETASILVDAARGWREARDEGCDVQPRLCAILSAHRCEMLTPALSSLMHFYEAGLGRPIVIGGEALSGDEHLLLQLIEGSRSRVACGTYSSELGAAFDCAICSARIMLAMRLEDARRLH